MKDTFTHLQEAQLQGQLFRDGGVGKPGKGGALPRGLEGQLCPSHARDRPPNRLAARAATSRRQSPPPLGFGGRFLKRQHVRARWPRFHHLSAKRERRARPLLARTRGATSWAHCAPPGLPRSACIHSMVSSAVSFPVSASERCCCGSALAATMQHCILAACRSGNGPALLHVHPCLNIVTL